MFSYVRDAIDILQRKIEQTPLNMYMRRSYMFLKKIDMIKMAIAQENEMDNIFGRRFQKPKTF